MTLDEFKNIIKVDFYLGKYLGDKRLAEYSNPSHPKSILGEDIYNIRPIIFSKKNYVCTDADTDILYPLPFKCISIEVSGDFLGSSTFASTISQGMVKQTVDLIVIKETNPGKHVAVFFGRTPDGASVSVYHQSYPQASELARSNLSVLINPYLKALHSSDFASRKVGIKRNVVDSRGKKLGQIKINQIVYCGKKSELKQIESSGIKLDYSHRFEVRGHWRRIRGIGKNRDGNYVMNGYTWIVPFEKGPENLPVIKKTRLFIENKPTERNYL